ncbi:MAG: C4-dicarboxylate TRAP transporter substrate-binding protein [Gammaproteobacteria bacterium]|nr:C4-dicarboxylate TRAP transporter substrate-binding protein [Gammaproteobacteria bacterium]MDH3429905.1 C4-dicarboxylate TRAP transporter substrate-binding protein [Gammaproteobacteria bacterium]
MLKRSQHVAMAGLMLILGGQPAAAGDKNPEVIPLIAVDSYATTALWTLVFVEYFIPEVDRRLAATGNYRIRWNKAFGGTIAKTRGVLDSLQYDLADLGIVTTPYHPDKVPFHNLPYATPLVTSDIGLAARTMSQLVDKYPVLAEQWRHHRLVFLTTAGSIDTYQVFTNYEVRTLDDFNGRKIAGVGLNLRLLTGLDASPVNSGISDWYNNLATGLIDGLIGWIEGSIAYRLYEVAPYMVDVRLGAVPTKSVVVNERTWGRLPQEVKTVLLEVAADYRDELARETDRRAARSTQQYLGFGGTILTLDDEQRRAWAMGLPNIAKEWADDMEERGMPGHDILRDYMDIMRANDQPIMRHWDRE